MKILITKDEHRRLGFRDKYRKPGWEKDMINKHQFIINLMKDKGIKYKVSTGDLFDVQKDWSFKQFIANKKISLMYQQAGLKEISPAGNHDMLEGRESIKDSIFEELVNDDLIIHINHCGYPLFDEELGEPVAEIVGFDYRHIESPQDKKLFLKDCGSWYRTTNDLLKIAVFHQNITPDKTRVTEFTYDELSVWAHENDVKVIICGHYHLGYPTDYFNDILFINPWNLWRVVRDYETQMDNHTPEVVILDTETLEFEHIQVPHKKYLEAFDPKEIEIFKEIQKETFDFFKRFSSKDLINDEEFTDQEILEKLKISLKDQFEATDEDIDQAIDLVKIKLN